MTNTTRDLIQRLADELDTWLMAHFHGGWPPEIQYAANLVIEAEACLAQPDPEEPTEEEIEKRFQHWWSDEGSGMRPSDGEDQEEHTRRVSQIAWSNGAYVAHRGRFAGR